MKSRILGFSLVAVAVVLSSACAGDPQPNTSQTDPHVSNIPWDHPESWEGQGPLSGMMPGQSR